MQREDKIETLHEAAVQGLGRKSDRIREVALPVLQQMSAANPDYDGPVLVPLTDGKRIFNLRCDLRTAIATEGRSIVKEWHKALMLVTIDELGKSISASSTSCAERSKCRLRAERPLVIYKVESFHLFETMLASTNSKAVAALMRGQIFMRRPAPSPCTKTPLRKWKNPHPSSPISRRPTPSSAVSSQTTVLLKPIFPAQTHSVGLHLLLGVKRETHARQGRSSCRSQRPLPLRFGQKYKNCHGKGL